MNLKIKTISSILAVFTATLLFTVITYANGGDNSECEDAQVNSHSAGSDDEKSYSADSDKVITGVCIKSGINMFNNDGHSDSLVNGDYEGGCYTVSGVGTSTVTVKRNRSSGDCQGISHLDIYKEAFEEPEPTPDPETPTTPDFPACRSYDGPGDYSHYDFGVHQIVGNGLVEGADDVYANGENFIQCFCAKDGNGIQTNWWRTDNILEGWFSENGWQWNFGDFNFLAKNSEYDCSDPEPTPTPTPPPDEGCKENCGDTPVCPASSPTATPQLSAFYTSDTSVMLTWNSVGPLTHYMIRYGTSPGNYQYGATNIGNVISYEVKDLDPNATYYFQVDGVNDCAAGHWSGEITPRRGGTVLGAHTSVDAGLGDSLGLIAAIAGIAGSIFLAISKLTNKTYIFNR